MKLQYLFLILVIGMCMQNGYYLESDSDWNYDSQAEIKSFPYTYFKVLYPNNHMTTSNKATSQENK